MSNYTPQNLITTTPVENARAIKIGNTIFTGFAEGGSSAKYYMATSSSSGTWQGLEYKVDRNFLIATGEQATSLTGNVSVGSVYTSDTSLNISGVSGVYIPLVVDVSTDLCGNSLVRNGTRTFDTVDEVPCCSLLGSGNYIGINSLKTSGGDFTISVWMKNVPDSSQSALVTLTGGTWGTTGNEFWVSFDTDGKINVTNGNSQSYIVAQQTATAGEWHHVAFSLTGGTLSLYVDNVKVTASTGQSLSSITKLYINTLGRTTSLVVGSGYYSSVRFWQRALTDSEVAVLYSEFS